MNRPFRLMSWNIRRLDEPWRMLVKDESLDIALLQEARPPPGDVLNEVVPSRDVEWAMRGYEQGFRTAAVRLSDRVSFQPRIVADLHEVSGSAMAVTRVGTLTAVDVTFGQDVVTCISAYAPWENVVSSQKSGWIISDANAHRLLSDMSSLIATKNAHRIIVAGDFNILRGHGEYGDPYWAKRYATVFDRAEALGLKCMGPNFPNGRRASPRPDELPKDSLNVPTYRSNRQTPETATRQLDFVFASAALAPRITTRALNEVTEWGPSDHCRVLIEVAPQ